MSKLYVPARTALAACLLSCLPLQAKQPTHPPQWSYQGPQGPARWAELDAGFEACAIGRHQSPIDMRGARPAELPELGFGYGSLSASIVDNGHTVQIDVPPGQRLQVGERRYELLQFHFHTPSEERIEGKAWPMVAHLVHRDAEGRLGVVAVLLQAGRAGSGFDAVLSRLPRREGKTPTPADFSLDLQTLLPRQRGYYDFEGSLTTPPCAEGVHWMVMREPVEVLPRSIAAFRRLYPANARPVQPLNGREVRVSR
ncbi:carbonic anhydrase family protein [Aquabacterium sp. A7-Y]|uniref:carbonic anhydrase n=1 Tax=Aquabacterium sp. A7-Y TaxID=1349605 RepID=UPI00223DDFA5|nr:carbonic anhydrase family protein [Aquabacterium sp. A7-Y]MCW7540827.1 carbonic anhydrase family protein [Aquabacterium sp. A7-Y]